MSDKEIAMQITICAMEHGGISCSSSDNDTHEAANKRRAKEICEFYKAIFEAVSHSSEATDKPQS